MSILRNIIEKVFKYHIYKFKFRRVIRTPFNNYNILCQKKSIGLRTRLCSYYMYRLIFKNVFIKHKHMFLHDTFC